MTKVTVWVEAETNKKAKTKAYNQDDVKAYLKDYNDLYSLNIISEDEDSKIAGLKRIKFNQLN